MVCFECSIKGTETLGNNVKSVSIVTQGCCVFQPANGCFTPVNYFRAFSSFSSKKEKKINPWNRQKTQLKMGNAPNGGLRAIAYLKLFIEFVGVI